MNKRLVIAFLGFMLFISCLSIIPRATTTAYTPTVDSYYDVADPNKSLVNDGQYASIAPSGWIILDLGSSYGNISCIEYEYEITGSTGRLDIYVSRNKATWFLTCYRLYQGTGTGLLLQSNRLSYELRDIRYVRLNAVGGYTHVDFVSFMDYPFVFNAGGNVYAKYLVSHVSTPGSTRTGSLGVGIGNKSSSLAERYYMGEGDSISYDFGELVASSSFQISGALISGSPLSVYVKEDPGDSWSYAGGGFSFAYSGNFRYANITLLAAGDVNVYGFYVAGGYNLTGSLLSSIVLNSPANGTTLYTKAVSFAFTPTWTVSNYSIVSAKLYVDGIVKEITWYPLLLNSTQNTISTTFSSYGTYSWYVRLYNSTAYIQSATRTLTLELGYYLTILYSPFGSTNPTNGTYAYAVGGTQAITATPSNSSWRWSYWLINGLKKNVYNPITAVMDKNYTYAPIFVSTATSNVTASMMGYLPYLLFIAGAGIFIVLARGRRNG